MMAEFVVQPPAGWFVLDVLPKGDEWEEGAEVEWAAIMIDIDPDDHRRGREAQGCFVNIPGRHGDKDAAWEVLDDMLATRH